MSYLAILLRQWDWPVKRTSTLMLYRGITLLLTGMGLVVIQFPAVNYWKVAPKSLLLLTIAGITAAHRDKVLSKPIWQLRIGLTVLTAFIALWRVA